MSRGELASDVQSLRAVQPLETIELFASVRRMLAALREHGTTLHRVRAQSAETGVQMEGIGDVVRDEAEVSQAAAHDIALSLHHMKREVDVFHAAD